MTDRRGFAAVELTAAAAVLLVPVLVLVATLPVWAEHRHAATAAAREAAVVAAREWPDERASEAGAATGRLVAEVHGLRPDEVVVTVEASPLRGGSITATVEVEMPALAVPALGTVGAWRYRASHTVRVDDYRSR